MNDPAAIATRLDAVRSRVAEAARAAGRRAEDVRIVAVSKKVGTDAVLAAYSAGQRDFGENYVQEAVGKIAETASAMPDARWHFVGRLQSNKAATAVGAFALLHGIDSMSTVAAISRAALREGRSMDLLLQVRLGERREAGGGAPRGGVEADAAAGFLREAAGFGGLRFVGLMGVADPELDARPQFAMLRELRDRLRGACPGATSLEELSMGMTGDLEDAVMEGATIVRIGTAIFGERPRG